MTYDLFTANGIKLVANAFRLKIYPSQERVLKSIARP